MQRIIAFITLLSPFAMSAMEEKPFNPFQSLRPRANSMNIKYLLETTIRLSLIKENATSCDILSTASGLYRLSETGNTMPQFNKNENKPQSQESVIIQNVHINPSTKVATIAYLVTTKKEITTGTATLNCNWAGNTNIHDDIYLKVEISRLTPTK